jgi:hypothetical protein
MLAANTASTSFSAPDPRGKVFEIIGSLHSAVVPDAPAQLTAAALTSLIDAATEAKSQIDTHDRDTMLRALALLYARAIEFLPDWIDRASIALAINALSALVIYWSRSEAPPNMVDLCREAYLLRNICEKRAELAEIARAADCSSFFGDGP